MEKADQILATMGISDAMPLSEAAPAPAHAVGKKYDESLPEVSDEQRAELLEGIFVPRTNKKVILKEGNQGQTDTSSIPTQVSSDEEVLKGLKKKKPVKKKPPTPDTVAQMDANAAEQGRAYAQERGRYPKIVADSLQISKLDALNEMTGVGSLGVSMANSSDPEKPYTMTKKKKSKKKNKKSLTNFLNNAFVITPKGY